METVELLLGAERIPQANPTRPDLHLEAPRASLGEPRRVVLSHVEASRPPRHCPPALTSPFWPRQSPLLLEEQERAETVWPMEEQKVVVVELRVLAEVSLTPILIYFGY